jgi:hypothetical protein
MTFSQLYIQVRFLIFGFSLSPTFFSTLSLTKKG